MSINSQSHVPSLYGIRENANLPFKYNTEYIHTALSMEQKLVVMFYKDGSRGREVQEENIFKYSSIKYRLANKAKLYETIEKNLFMGAVNYILDDKVASLKYLQESRIEIYNNAIYPSILIMPSSGCFAILLSGVVIGFIQVATLQQKNIAFIYSLLESCKLNHLLKDILTRIMKGEEVDSSFLPNHYVPRQKREQKVA